MGSIHMYNICPKGSHHRYIHKLSMMLVSPDHDTRPDKYYMLIRPNHQDNRNNKGLGWLRQRASYHVDIPTYSPLVLDF